MRAREVKAFKLWYSSGARGKNMVSILVDRDPRELVVDVRRVKDRLMSIKLVVGGFTLNVISAYAPQVGLDEEVKSHFWDVLDKVVRGIPHTKKLFIGGDFNGYVRENTRGYDEKKEDYFVTFWSTVAKTQIDYLLFKRCDKGLCSDCKVIPSECLSIQHRLLVMDLEIKRVRKKKAVYGQPKIKWRALTNDKAQELGEKYLDMCPDLIKQDYLVPTNQPFP
ncbi:PREDICTED: uncharacterized protein LOC109214364 [Nicotiana attenuata]|uniref:uncharacterized protein LOC109214364 n=1 Tax=Nicotiana attenuata TaxID=49451 RepID=UPI0009054CAF|nr:PREDICTED: uncharacterized protein LOC109214364 [Nicotiana attenuata]